MPRRAFRRSDEKRDQDSGPRFRADRVHKLTAKTQVHVSWAGALLASALSGSPVFAAHPLITEDTGTQGQGRFQLELTAEFASDTELGVKTRSAEYATVLTYGLLDNLDVLVTLPYMRLRTETDGSATSTAGVGDMGLDAKWRFFERADLSVVLKAGLSYPSGDENEGLGTGYWNYSVNLVTSYANGPWGYHLHLGYWRNRNALGEIPQIHHASVALTYQASEAWRLVADIGNDTSPDPSYEEDRVFLTLGAIFSLRENFDLDLGLRRALSDPEVDNTLLLGMAWRF